MEMKFRKTVKFVVINLLENLDDGNETDSHLTSGQGIIFVKFLITFHAMPLLGDQKKTEARFIHNLKWHGLVHNLRMVITNLEQILLLIITDLRIQSDV